MTETTETKKKGRPRKNFAPEQANTPSETVVQLPIASLRDWENHPIKMREDDTFQAIVESVKEHGVLTPILVRPKGDGYEILSGRRRRLASELTGLDTTPCIVREIDDDTAAITLVDCSLQREMILPMEKAMLFNIRLEAMRHKAGRPSKEPEAAEKENAPQVATNFRSDDEVAKEAGVSGDTVRRYVRLLNLNSDLQGMVDDGKIAVTPASELSFLTPEEQGLLLDTIESEQATPSLSQAQRMKKLSQGGGLNEDTMLEIMMEQKKPEKDSITLSGDKLRKYFPRSYTPLQMETTIFKLLEAWQRKRQRDQAR